MALTVAGSIKDFVDATPDLQAKDKTEHQARVEQSCRPLQ